VIEAVQVPATKERRVHRTRTVAILVSFVCWVAVFLAFTPASAADGALRGHGGPVRSLAVSPDGKTAISGSFDQSAIIWRLDSGAALSVLRFHDGAVNAVAAMPDGRFVTAGEDGRIAIWKLGEAAPLQAFQEHNGPIVALAISRDGQEIASASWDETASLRSLRTGETQVFKGHRGNVNGVGFLPDGRLVSAGYDNTLRLWPRDATSGAVSVVTLASPVNALAVSAEGDIIAAGADGVVSLFASDGIVKASVETQEVPITSLALSADGDKIAAASIGGSITVIDRRAAKVLFQIPGNKQPVWSLAFRPQSNELLSGGNDRLIRRWNAGTGAPMGDVIEASSPDIPAALAGERGAQVFRACTACHTLKRDAENRAGPSLYHVFGRRIATAPGYNFSPALKQLDIIWNAETIAKLFEIGPSRYTPGTKMPEQRIDNAADREALIKFLEKATTN
jgi:cytochrome c